MAYCQLDHREKLQWNVNQNTKNFLPRKDLQIMSIPWWVVQCHVLTPWCHHKTTHILCIDDKKIYHLPVIFYQLTSTCMKKSLRVHKSVVQRYQYGWQSNDTWCPITCCSRSYYDYRIQCSNFTYEKCSQTSNIRHIRRQYTYWSFRSMSVLLQLHLHSRLNTWFQWTGQRKTTARRNCKNLSFGIRCVLYYRFYGISTITGIH